MGLDEADDEVQSSCMVGKVPSPCARDVHVHHTLCAVVQRKHCAIPASPIFAFQALHIQTFVVVTYNPIGYRRGYREQI